MYIEWQKIVRQKVSERQAGIWSDFCSKHPDLKVAQPKQRPFLPFLDLFNFGFNGRGVPWLRGTDGANCFICKHTVVDTNHFLFNCPSFKDHFALLSRKSEFVVLILLMEV